jgi:hypothetical protein
VHIDTALVRQLCSFTHKIYLKNLIVERERQRNSKSKQKSHGRQHQHAAACRPMRAGPGAACAKPANQDAPTYVYVVTSFLVISKSAADKASEFCKRFYAF